MKNSINQILSKLKDMQAKPLVAALSVLAYVIIFNLLYQRHGSGMAISAGIPVVFFGWLYGFVPGILAGALTLPANFVMSLLFGIHWWEKVFMAGAGVSGTIACVVLGGVVGRMHDLAVNVEKEVERKTQAEREIQEKQQQLNTLHEQLWQEMEDYEGTIQRLTEKKKEIESLIEISTDPMIIADRQTNIIQANRAFLEMAGCTDEQAAVGRPVKSFMPEKGIYTSRSGETVVIDAAFSDGVEDSFRLLFEEGCVVNRSSYCVNASGKIVPVSVNAAIVDEDRDDAVALFAIIRDITPQRITEREFIEARNTAEEANRSKSAFLANMSHELRTPMNGIIGFTEMLMDTSLDAEQIDYAHTVKRSAEHLLSLINDILDFSKIEAGKIHIEKVDFDIEMLVYDICDAIRPRIGEKRIELLCRIDENLPATVKGDPHRYRQVLLNLMGNAAKFTEEGEIEICVRLEREQDNRLLIHTLVRDSGVGISAENIEQIFNIFQQADGSSTRKFGGTGLGLSICKKIANLMGGEVWAESTPGTGSTFHFSAWFDPAEAKHVKRLIPVSLSGKRVLIVDDNTTNLEILSHIVKASGMKPCTCSTSVQALELLKKSVAEQTPFDICILDIMMPEISGYELARDIRDTCSRHLPLLAFSSSTEGGVKHCMDAGFNGFLPKPINRVKLLKMMERLISSAGSDTRCFEHEETIITQYSMREDAKHSISILLAEDNPVNRKLATKLLSKAGYGVISANNGREAVDLFSDSPEAFDIVFMDIQMPELDGLEATRLLRKKGFNTIPIIALTASTTREDERICLDAGMNDFITKPIKRAVVFDVLRKWVFERV